MTVNYKAGRVDSCILVAEINGEKYSLNVDIPSIESSMQMIKDTFGPDCKRVYISGFDLVSKDSNIRGEDLIDRIRKSNYRTNAMQKEKVRIMK